MRVRSGSEAQNNTARLSSRFNPHSGSWILWGNSQTAGPGLEWGWEEITGRQDGSFRVEKLAGGVRLSQATPRRGWDSHPWPGPGEATKLQLEACGLGNVTS